MGMTNLSGHGKTASFRHGVHPVEHKDHTNRLAIERIPFVDEYVLPLAQHIGAPAIAAVRAGQEVLRGQLIAKPGGFVSTAVHSPVRGVVKAVELRPHPSGRKMPAVVIATDPYASQRDVFSKPPPFRELDHQETLRLIQEAGLVGLGGAAFPTHVKLKLPEGKKVRWVTVNGCECEPYLTCDHRVMLQRPESVIRGLRLFMELLNAESGYIGIEINKSDAIEALRKCASPDPSIHVVPLEVKYPQGAEKMLIDAIFHREIPSGKLPLDLEIVVQNVGTTSALAEFFDRGMPLIERVVTVNGSGIPRPGNYLVPVGTPIQAVLDHCGGLRPDTRQVIMGGPMMGMAQKNLDAPVIKGTSGLLALTTDPPDPGLEEPCIRCGRCLAACPIFLNPSRLATLVRNERTEELKTNHLADCFECASCSYVCPSRIPLVQLMRMGKAQIRRKEAAK